MKKNIQLKNLMYNNPPYNTIFVDFNFMVLMRGWHK